MEKNVNVFKRNRQPFQCGVVQRVMITYNVVEWTGFNQTDVWVHIPGSFLIRVKNHICDAKPRLIGQ